MKRRNLLMIFLVMLTVTATIAPITVGQISQVSKLSITPLRTKRVPIGGTFKINITLAEVTQLFGYQYVLYYNTRVLTAMAFKNLAYLTYSRLNELGPSEINDDPWDNQTGYVAVVYDCPIPEFVGLTTIAPVPLTEITFRVDAVGASELEIREDQIAFANIYGEGIAPRFGNMLVVNGYYIHRCPSNHNKLK